MGGQYITAAAKAGEVGWLSHNRAVGVWSLEGRLGQVQSPAVRNGSTIIVMLTFAFLLACFLLLRAMFLLVALAPPGDERGTVIVESCLCSFGTLIYW